MKLDPEHLPRIARESVPVDRPSGRGRVKDSQTPESPPKGPNRDGLVLTPEADRFSQLRARVKALPDTGQTERLARIKAQIAAGRYEVDGQKIAGAMLDDEPTAALFGLRSSR